MRTPRACRGSGTRRDRAGGGGLASPGAPHAAFVALATAPACNGHPVMVHRNGWARSRFYAAMNASTAVRRSSTERKLASRRHCCCRMLKNSSTWLTPEACLGV